MLILGRHVNEKIVIDGGIIITVIEVRPGNYVKLGIECPRHIRIDREEIARLRAPKDDVWSRHEEEIE